MCVVAAEGVVLAVVHLEDLRVRVAHRRDVLLVVCDGQRIHLAVEISEDTRALFTARLPEAYPARQYDHPRRRGHL